jgi:hypothetical protein
MASSNFPPPPAGYDTLRDLGGFDDGLDGGTTFGSPVDNDEYYTFDGNDGIEWASALDESDIDIWLSVRLDGYRWNDPGVQTLWKSGGATAGFAIGIDERGRFGVFGRSGGALTSITMPSGLLPVDEFFEVYASTSKITIVFQDDSGYTVTGTVTAADGSAPESTGFGADADVIFNSGSDAATSKISIDKIAIYTAGNLSIPTKTTAADTDDWLRRYHFGSNNNGTDGFLLNNTPTDNGDYYTFDDASSQGLKMGNATAGPYEEPSVEIIVKFRAHDKAGGEQTLWKAGGHINGIAVGFDSSGNLGMFGNSSSAQTSITISSDLVTNDKWYILYANGSKVILEDFETRQRRGASGSISYTVGTASESVGYGEDSCPISQTDSDEDYFDGDIEYVEIHANGAKITDPPTTSVLAFIGQNFTTQTIAVGVDDQTRMLLGMII